MVLRAAGPFAQPAHQRELVLAGEGVGEEEAEHALVAELERALTGRAEPVKERGLAGLGDLVRGSSSRAVRVLPPSQEPGTLEPRELGVDLRERRRPEGARRDVRRLLDRVARPRAEPHHPEHEEGGRLELQRALRSGRRNRYPESH